MRPLLQVLQRTIVQSAPAARTISHVSSLHTSTAVRNIADTPFHRLFTRHAQRLRNNHGSRTPRRWYSEPSHQTKSQASSASSASAAKNEPTGLTARLRKLSREYGWSVFGVYMALTALDFPFCFLAVRWFGTERIAELEHAAVQWIKRAVPIQWPEKWASATKEIPVEGPVDGAVVTYDHGVREAEAANRSEAASIWTQLALAYAIHKSFIFIRVPLTAAITPKVVRTLRGWGWNIGKIKPKAERVAARAERKAAQAQKQVQPGAIKTAKDLEK